MIWEKIVKNDALINLNRSYKLCKEDLSVEAKHRCVYCCIHESRWGGIRNFHVEHYKPKSIFTEDINNYNNLFYACSVCNGFKGNDWPNDQQPTFDVAFYPNPIEYNYSELIQVDYENGNVRGNNFTANYIIEKLYLNRRQLINERIFYWYNKKFLDTLPLFQEYIKILLRNSQNEKTKKLLEKFFEHQCKISKLYADLNTMIPYKKQDISR
ncbi:hypothetical protein C1637_10085 [Chryseobacterium lactis]|uniref:HNH endonuclease n=2 Tax=Chryseobacterium TaxID=59732 RepID=A0A3G6RBU1_CHRLC|nr:hypothetical protein [Chryseobacterium lactis]AZA82140.1 hypothetical protein EG342_09610 [Chryseobacterium lactis]AZB02521.1 hypothetical protein EG341_00465 [Chryseobacterium lactis]PNW14183.1 hypothetical protein C1637_10085 [Chryseobacterium lactis]